VIGVKDSIPDMPHPPRIDEFGKKTDYIGNLVLLDIGDGIIASYAHLLAFSIKVHVGDTLRKGDLIGKIGSSGNSTGPHLHFHLSKPDYSVVNKADINGIFIVSEGISYVFDEYLKYNVVSGKIIDLEGMTEWISEPFVLNNPINVKKSLPSDKEIIEIIEK
jgi:murein DD-endopeptidase MepM/ murein hydrolase activator NlpD